jgi:hypothetical protein
MIRIISKKAMMKTVEVFMAMMITFIFLMIILPSASRNSNNDSYDNLFRNLEFDDLFRSCVLIEDETCIDSIIERSFYGYYQYDYEILDSISENSIVTNLPKKQVQIYSIVISGNYTSYNPKIFRLYYWIRSSASENETGRFAKNS